MSKVAPRPLHRSFRDRHAVLIALSIFALGHFAFADGAARIDPQPAAAGVNSCGFNGRVCLRVSNQNAIFAF
jgi:hypothetical protein